MELIRNAANAQSAIENTITQALALAARGSRQTQAQERERRRLGHLGQPQFQIQSATTEEHRFQEQRVAGMAAG